MKPLLNLFWEFGEVNFCDSQFGFDDDTVRLDAADSCVFVFFPVKRFEVLREDG